MRHIGLFFGTFDPLHNGHVSIAKYFIKKLSFDELWLVVTPLNPFKNSKNITNESKRLGQPRSLVNGSEGLGLGL